MKLPNLYITHPGRLELLRLVPQIRVRELRQRWRRRFPPRRRVLDHACPILRWDAGQVMTAFMERLSCGHLLALTDRPRPRRRCWKCARGLPRDARARRGSIFTHRYVEYPGVLTRDERHTLKAGSPVAINVKLRVGEEGP